MFDKYSNSFLNDFNFDSILEKFERKTFRNYSAGDSVYDDNDYIHDIYFILTGEVKLIKTENYNNIQFTLRKLSGGDIIGVEDALTGSRFTSSAYTTQNSNILVINKEDFIDLTKVNDEFNFWVLKYLSSGLFV